MAGWVGYIAHMGDMTNADQARVAEPEGSRPMSIHYMSFPEFNLLLMPRCKHHMKVTSIAY
jgi:hypothetical protein